MRPTIGRPPGAVAVLAMAATLVLLSCGAERADVDDDVGAGAEIDDVDVGDEDPTLADEGVDAVEEDDGTGAGDGGDVGDRADVVPAQLEVTAGVEDDTDALGQALLTCGADGAVGALWLDGAAAVEACTALSDRSLLARLDPPRPGEVCAEVDGGPQVATVVGTVGDVQVDAVVRRGDGCGVARWDALSPLLPPLDDADAVG